MTYKSNSELKNTAREMLSGKYGSSMLVMPVIPYALTLAALFPLMMMIFIPYIVIEAANGTEVGTGSMLTLTLILAAIIIICDIFIGMLNAGISLFFLNIACGKRHSISDIFFGFRWQFKKTIAFSALLILLSNLCTLPYQVFSILNEFNPQAKWTVLSLIFYIIAMVIYIPIHLALSQYYYLMLDFPGYSIKELLNLSIRIMKGQKKRLFLLQLSFVPLELLCVCSCGIGYLWYYPYMLMTNTLFFLDIMQPTTNTVCNETQA